MTPRPLRAQRPRLRRPAFATCRGGGERSRRRAGGVTVLAPLALVVAALMGILASGCGTDSAVRTPATPPSSPAPAPDAGAGSPDLTPPGSSAPGPTPAPSAAELEVRALIDHYWPIYLRSMMAPDADHAELGAMLSGDANFRVLGRITDLARAHHRVEMPEPSVFEHHTMSVTFGEEDLATVRECVVDDLRIVADEPFRDAAGVDHLIVIDDDVATVEYTTALRLDGDRWRMNVREITESLEGVRDCGIFS